MSQRTPLVFSKTSLSPPTNIVSSPVIAFGVLPVTGASRKWIPCFSSFSPIFVAHSTPIVDISITVDPGLREVAAPSNPKSTSSTSSHAVTIVMRTSTSLASIFFVSQTFAPRFFSSSVRSGVRFQTKSSLHFETIFFAMGIPMSPSPIKPIFIEWREKYPSIVFGRARKSNGKNY